MPGAFAAAIARASEASPQAGSATIPEKGRVLLVDGDGLAYFCAGSDECDPGQARINLLNKLANAKACAGAEFVRVLATAQGSHKGHRYAVARAKPYQGQRKNGRRPKNWDYLRQLIEGTCDPRYPTELVGHAEADDLFGKYAFHYGPSNVVHYTQDKDMRMLPGWHMDWKDHRMTYVAKGAYDHVHNDLQYGRKWFWLQMLHGDDTDNIPGLPRLVREDGKAVLCGKVTAGKLLAGCKHEYDAALRVCGAYQKFYASEPDWRVPMLEQAVLLWMRTDPKSSALDVCAEGNPMDWCPPDTVKQILMRIAEGQV